MDTTSQPGTRSQEWVPGMSEVLFEVAQERMQQVARYGHNDDLESGMGSDARWLSPYSSDSADEVEQQFRSEYEEYEEQNGKPTWAHLLREELAEAIAEDDVVLREQEMLQVAALAVSYVETSRRLRGALPS